MEEQEYMVMKTASAKSARTMASQVGVRRARANDSKASRLGGRLDTRRHWRFDRFSLKIGESVTSCSGVREGLNGLASKPGETGLTGLGLKTGGGLGAVKVRMEGMWRHCKACVEAKRSREGGVSVRGFYKRLDKFAPA